MKQSVPPTAKIAKDAKECVQECVSEFISFITSEAAEKCQMEKRKTIGGEDILYAMVTLGFENYAETLKIHLAKLRQVRARPRVLICSVVSTACSSTKLVVHRILVGTLETTKNDRLNTPLRASTGLYHIVTVSVINSNSRPGHVCSSSIDHRLYHRSLLNQSVLVRLPQRAFKRFTRCL